MKVNNFENTVVLAGLIVKEELRYSSLDEVDELRDLIAYFCLPMNILYFENADKLE